MSRVVVIGGTGHIGTYLVPRLVSAGFEVVSVSRGERAPYQLNGAWKFVRTVILSREAEENAGSFGRKIGELRPDIVIDMICFAEASARDIWWKPCADRCSIFCILERSGCTAPPTSRLHLDRMAVMASSRGNSGMVRPRAEASLSALAEMEGRAKRVGGGADLRSHRA